MRVRPRGKADRIRGLVGNGGGGVRLAVEVTAAPEGGKANAAVCGLLAKGLGLPKSAVSVRAGASARDKTIRIVGAARDSLEGLTGTGRSAKRK